MIGKIIANKKYRDYYNFTNWECKVSIVITALIFLLLISLNIDIYNDFNNYIEVIQNIIIYVAAGLLAMIGVILAAITFILSLLDKKFRDSIKVIDGDDPVKDIMLSFEFLVFNLGISSIFLFVTYFLTASNMYIDRCVFNLFLFMLIYYVLFLIFYTIALIENTIELYFIKNLYEEIEGKDKSLYDKVNEIRIDYLIRNSSIESSEKLILDLEEMINDMDVKNKEELKKYIRDYYS